MSIAYKGSAVFVSNMKDSRWFYETVLGQSPQIDAGDYISYGGGVAIWQKDVASGLIHDGPFNGTLGADNFELYFETDEIEDAWEKINQAGAKVQRPLKEEPWGQRSFRLFDPDDYLVEIAEPMPSVIKRLLTDGMSPEDVHKKTHMPINVINEIAGS